MTHVTTEDINGVNYISEGFLSRYTFEFKKTGGIWGIIGAIIGTIALVAATIFSFSAASIFAAPSIVGIFGAATGASVAVSASAAIIGTAIGASAAIGAAVLAGVIHEGVTAI
jgi:hypothetical protein